MTASKCTYKFSSGKKCGEDIYKTPPYRIRRVFIENDKERYSEKVYNPLPYCILHLELPIEADPLYNEIKSAKDAKVQAKIDPKNSDFNFEGAKIYSVDLSGRQDISDLCFDSAMIKEYAWFKNATIKGPASFNGVWIEGNFIFDSATIKRQDSFNGATIKGPASFDSATLEGRLILDSAGIKEYAFIEYALFNFATIKGDVSFNDATIEGTARFTGATIGGNAWFENATIKGHASFKGAAIKEYAWFNGATIEGDIKFLNAEIANEDFSKTIIKPARIMGGTNFERAVIKGDALFNDALICGKFECHSTEIIGKLSFENTKFTRVDAQEEAYRKAKQVWDTLGDRKTADDFFYKEMVAKRKQKKPDISLKEAIRMSRDKSDKVNHDPLAVKNYLHEYVEYLLEAPLQYALGYGVYPRRLMFTWIFIAITLGAFLTGASRNMNDLPFGIAAAFVPGYGLSSSNAFSGVSLWIVCVATIFSAFFWAAFITVFSRKFMR